MRIDLVYANAPFSARGHRRLRRPRGAQGQPQGRQGTQRPRPARRRPHPLSATDLSCVWARGLVPTHDSEDTALAQAPARRVCAMPLDVRPIDARPISRSSRSARRPSCSAPPGRASRPSGGTSRWAGTTARPSSAPASSCCGAPPDSSATSPTSPRGRSSTGRRSSRSTCSARSACALKKQKAFAVKIGPQLPVRRWSAATLKAAIADGQAKRLRDVPPDSVDKDAVALTDALTELRLAAGRRQRARASATCSPGTSSSCRWPDAPRTTLLAGFNQLWRRNIKKADKAGVEVSARRLRRPQGLPRALRHHRQAGRLHPARADVLPADVEGRCPPRTPTGSSSTSRASNGEVLAATTAVRVGSHVWYSYGASADHLREVRPSNAIQWRMMRDALSGGAERLRPPRHLGHPRPREPPLRPHPVQAGHRRRGGRVRRRVGLCR